MSNQSYIVEKIKDTSYMECPDNGIVPFMGLFVVIIVLIMMIFITMWGGFTKLSMFVIVAAGVAARGYYILKVENDKKIEFNNLESSLDSYYRHIVSHYNINKSSELKESTIIARKHLDEVRTLYGKHKKLPYLKEDYTEDYLKYLLNLKPSMDDDTTDDDYMNFNQIVITNSIKLIDYINIKTSSDIIKTLAENKVANAMDGVDGENADVIVENAVVVENAELSEVDDAIQRADLIKEGDANMVKVIESTDRERYRQDQKLQKMLNKRDAAKSDANANKDNVL
jgi:hypothetical protein